MPEPDYSTSLPPHRRFDWRVLLQRFGPFIALVLIVAFTAWRSDRFLTPQNITNILRQNTPVGILALGMTFVIILGGIDLSVGSLIALAGGVGILALNFLVQGGMVENAYAAVGLAFAVTILAGVLAGLLNGVLITAGRVPPFIATLGTMAAFRSIPLSIVDAGEFRPDAAMTWYRVLGTGGVPIPFTEVRPGVPLQVGYPVLVFAALFFVTWVMLKRTRYGRYVIAVGCNEQAARYSAINVNRIKLITYTLMGSLAGIAALLQASRFNSVSSSNSGLFYELDAIAAVAIGGTSMRGGSGTIPGTIVGVLMLGVIANMLNMLNVSPYLQGLVKGCIVIGAVLLQRGRRTD